MIPPTHLPGRCFAIVLWSFLALLPTRLQAEILPTELQAKTAMQMVGVLEKRHYSKRRFDDQLSSLLLDNYLNNLDSGRLFFLQSDVEEFERYRLLLDDQLGGGNLEAGFAIFDRYRQRMEQRLRKLLQQLPHSIAAMDFSLEEELTLNPERRAWAASTSEADERWRKQLKNAVLSLKLADKEESEIAPTLHKRYQNQLQRIAQYNAQDVFQLFANSLAELYDPHTAYLSPRHLENFNINMSLSLEGIGAVLQQQDEYTQVSRIVPAGPADKQGQLRPSDRIVAVGQDQSGAMEDVIGWRLDDVVQLIRGPKGSTVRLQVIPADAKTPDERDLITIVRNRVKLEEQGASKKIVELAGGETRLGVIEIPAFYVDFEAQRRGDDDFRSTTRDVRRLLDELVAESVDGLIIDLRNNSGGALQEANALTGLFIEYGPTVQIRHFSRKVSRVGKRRSGPYYTGPMAVLINRLSASAAEIFAGAIQDYQRGIILGGRSFGKGTVQTMLPLHLGQLKVTESKFYRVSGESTQHRGVIPDLMFPPRFDSGEIGESALDHALAWDRIDGVRHHKYYEISSLLPQLQDRHEQRTRDDPDFRYLRDSLALAAAVRQMESLPLNQAARLALRDSQQAKSLALENSRRLAKGLEPLRELAEDPDNDTTLDAGGSGDETAAEEQLDVLLVQAGNILADILLLDNQIVASSL